MYPLISVNIPAYNEEKQIQNTLESVLKQDYPGELEIKVCANGCTDNTEQKVLEMKDKYSNIGLVCEKEKGKPNAWNLLREIASSDYQVFLDGDVILEADAIKELYRHLKENPQLVAVGSSLVSHNFNDSYIDRFVKIPSGDPGALVGRLYLIDNHNLKKVFQSKGFNKMPEDIIHEDLWLSLFIGLDNLSIASGSKVHYSLPTWTDLKKSCLRGARGYKQIEERYSQVLTQSENSKNSFLRKLNKLNSEKGMLKLYSLMTFFYTRFYEQYYKFKIQGENFENDLEGWETTDSSKTPFVLN